MPGGKKRTKDRYVLCRQLFGDRHAEKYGQRLPPTSPVSHPMPLYYVSGRAPGMERSAVWGVLSGLRELREDSDPTSLSASLLQLASTDGRTIIYDCTGSTLAILSLKSVSLYSCFQCCIMATYLSFECVVYSVS